MALVDAALKKSVPEEQRKPVIDMLMKPVPANLTAQARLYRRKAGSKKFSGLGKPKWPKCPKNRKQKICQNLSPPLTNLSQCQNLSPPLTNFVTVSKFVTPPNKFVTVSKFVTPLTNFVTVSKFVTPLTNLSQCQNL